MQNPTSYDPSFKKFLDDLKQQNNKAFAAQLLQVKAEREMAGEDNDKREDQLQEMSDKLKEIRVAVTGINLDLDLTPLVDSLSNQTDILRKSLEEQSLLRKISEGSLEYDKASAQYRNTSGREIVSDVSGKVIKKGGYVDFETATNRLAGQSNRVRDSQANQLNLKGISYTPGSQITTNNVNSLVSKEKVTRLEKGAKEKESKVETLGGLDDLLKEIVNRFVDAGKYATNTQPGKQKTANISANAESDNIESPSEIMAENSKIDLDIAKQGLDIQQQQLVELKKISSIFGTPSGSLESGSKKENKPLQTSSALEASSDSSKNLPGINLPSKGKGPNKVPGTGSKILSGILKGAKVLGPLAAAAGAAYSGFEGYKNTAANFDLKEGQEATLGQKTASTLGGVASGLTFGLVDEKVAAQNIHKAGEYVGEKAKAAYAGAKELGSKAVSFAGEKAVQAKEAISSAGSKVYDFFASKTPSVIEAAKSAVTSLTPGTRSMTGTSIAKTTTENADLGRINSSAPTNVTPVLTNNVNNVNTTSYVPINPTARLANTGSALDQYLLRTAVY